MRNSGAKQQHDTSMDSITREAVFKNFQRQRDKSRERSDEKKKIKIQIEDQVEYEKDEEEDDIIDKLMFDA